MIPTRAAPLTRRERWLLALIVIVGMAMQALMSSRVGMIEDQQDLLRPAWEFAETGHLAPVGKRTSGEGAVPGCLLQLITGLPLKVWPDPRANYVVVGLLFVAAGALLAWTIHQAAGPRFLLAYLSIYWLSPWLYYHSAWMLEPSYLFLPAAAHLWACWSQRERPSARPSFVLGLALAATPQIHGSALILWFLTAGLLLTRRVRVLPRWGILGLAAGALTLIPTVLAALQGTLPHTLPRHGYVGLGLREVLPVLKGAGFWLRMPSLDITRPIRDTIFFDSSWRASRVGSAGIHYVAQFVSAAALASVAAVLVANVWYFRRTRAGEQAGLAPGVASSEWLRGYSAWALAGVLLSSALSPVWIQGWYVVIVLHAACLPAAAWIVHSWPRWGPFARSVLCATAALRIVEVLMLTFGHINWRPT